LSGSFSQRELRDAFGLFATGVTVVTAVRPDGEPVGVTVNSFASVSLHPPLLLWCLAKGSSAGPAFTPKAAFAVHVLGHEQRELAMHFARRTVEKFEVDSDFRVRPHPPHIADAICRFDCRVHAVHEGGDHLIVVGDVLAIVRARGRPLAFHAGRFGSFSAEGAAELDVWQAAEDRWF